MATTYTKPHLTVPEQVQLLSSRGMAIPDRSSAERWLGVVGYYRLSGYSYPYRVRQPGSRVRADQFTAGTSLDQVVALYGFDRELKLLILDALERIEIAMRFRVGYTLGRRGAYAHLSPTNLDGAFTRSRSGRNSTYDTWLRKTGAAQASSHENFVEHFRTKYDGRLPVWVVTEILDFGSLSFLYAGLKRPDRDEITHELGVSDMAGAGDGAALRTWMQVLNYLRNVGGHHSRLWNRNMTVPADGCAAQAQSSVTSPDDRPRRRAVPCLRRAVCRQLPARPRLPGAPLGAASPKAGRDRPTAVRSVAVRDGHAGRVGLAADVEAEPLPAGRLNLALTESGR